ncbi:MAG: GatB/YqeY domain-containing protein [Anaerolineae bacterium]
MSIREQLQADLKEAMRGGDAAARTVIRAIMTAIKEAEQRKREELAKKALEKHRVARPTDLNDAAALAAYNQAVEAALSAEGIEEASLLDEAEILALIQKLVKQRQDSIAEAERAGRGDIAGAEAAEMTILQRYLPRQMTREEIEAEARALIAQVGASGPRDMGKVMGPLTARLKGRADGRLISEVVKSLLSEQQG